MAGSYGSKWWGVAGDGFPRGQSGASFSIKEDQVRSCGAGECKGPVTPADWISWRNQPAVRGPDFPGGEVEEITK